MKKMLLLVVTTISFLSASADNSKNALNQYQDFMQKKVSDRAERIYAKSKRSMQKQKPKQQLEYLTSKLKSFESLCPNLKNKLDPEEQLQFVALLETLGKLQ